MPKFQDGISPIKWALLCAFFMVNLGQLRNLLIIKDRKAVVVKLSIVAITLNIIANYVAIKAGFGITGVAASSSIAAFFFFLSLSIVALKYAESVSLLSFLASVLIPPLCLLLALLALDHFVIYGNLIVEFVIKVFFFLLASLFVGFYINRRTNIVTIVLKIITNRIKEEISAIRY
jgi:O-antigen/teichoic acid export membrane protein